jgi:hypothetical protein
MVPEKFENAWNHPDDWQSKKWQEAIVKELTKNGKSQSMESNQMK